ncbi:MAG: alkaline phosphatase family protein [Planctomycetota bacterium]
MIRYGPALSFAALMGAAPACSEPADLPAAPPPRLVTVLVVDQMRHDYLDRFRPVLEGGLLRLIRSGLSFTDARHLHAGTNTGPGHATLSTGSHPSRHGIVANSLPEEAPGTFRTVTVDRREHNLNGNGKAAGCSPRDLLVPALGDWLKAERPGAKVVSVAIKGRAAVLLGGQGPDASVYGDGETGEFTTSSFYAKKQPDWVAEFNRTHPPQAQVGRVWTPLLDEARLEDTGVTRDAMSYEGRSPLGDLSDASFPHAVTTVSDLVFTPFGDERTLALATAAIFALGLGADEEPDLLLVSLSSADYIGHAYGPDSREVCEYYAWLDEALPAFFEALERAAGADRQVLVLTADHGVNPVVERLCSSGLPAGRVPKSALEKTIDRELDQRFGEADWVFSARPDVFLDHRVAGDLGLDLELVRDAAIQAVRSIPGIRTAYSFQRLSRGDETVPESFRLSFHPERSGDLMLDFERHFHLDYLDSAAYVKSNHGTQYDYDQRVPMIFLGPAIPAGIRGERFGSIDLAPTLARLLQVTPPRAIDGCAHDLVPLNAGTR